MIGMVCTSVFQYYDSSQKKMAFKGRPILVIGKADAGDYVALPISEPTSNRSCMRVKSQDSWWISGRNIQLLIKK